MREMEEMREMGVVGEMGGIEEMGKKAGCKTQPAQLLITHYSLRIALLCR